MSAAISSLFGGVLIDRVGRKFAILFSDLLLVAGPLLMFFTSQMRYLFLGRILIGAGLGVSILSSSIFLAEWAPSKVRGNMVALYQQMIATGTLIAFLLSVFAWNWNLLIVLGLIPALLQFFLIFFFVDETP